MTTQKPTPLPWAAWKLAPDSDPQQRHIIVTADGEQEITSFVQREADAHHIARCVNSHDRLLESLQELLADIDGLASEFEICNEIIHSSYGKAAYAAIAEATGSLPPEPRKPIVIEVLGGVVQDVHNVPPGYDYEIMDYDDLEAEGEAADGRSA